MSSRCNQVGDCADRCENAECGGAGTDGEGPSGPELAGWSAPPTSLALLAPVAASTLFTLNPLAEQDSATLSTAPNSETAYRVMVFYLCPVSSPAFSGPHSISRIAAHNSLAPSLPVCSNVDCELRSTLSHLSTVSTASTNLHRSCPVGRHQLRLAIKLESSLGRG